MEKKAQKLVQTKDLRPGMVVSKPVHSFQGALLLKEDTPLDEKKIKLLKTWGVDTVSVWAEDGKEEDNSFQRLKAEIQERIILRFSKFEQNPLMQQLKNVALDLATLEG